MVPGGPNSILHVSCFSLVLPLVLQPAHACGEDSVLIAVQRSETESRLALKLLRPMPPNCEPHLQAGLRLFDNMCRDLDS